MNNYKKFLIFIACLLVIFNLGNIFIYAATYDCHEANFLADGTMGIPATKITGTYSDVLTCSKNCGGIQKGTCKPSDENKAPVNFSVDLVESEVLTKYKLLQTLPGYKYDSEGGKTNLENYLSWLYRFALAAAAFLAFLMMVIGGIQMIVGGASETARSDGKKKIEDAIWGLLLAVSAWLILYSINPQLVGMGLSSTPSVNVVGTANEKNQLGGNYQTVNTLFEIQQKMLSNSHYSRFPGLLGKDLNGKNWTLEEQLNLDTHDMAMKKYNLAGIQVTSSKGASGVCADQATCTTSMNGIPKKTVDTHIKIVSDLKKSSDPELRKIVDSYTLTGGTEKGHNAQGFGKGSSDVRYSEKLYEYLKANQKKYNIKVVRECVSKKDLCPSHATSQHISVYNI